MSAPSAVHESRVALLQDLAQLAGFTVPTRLDSRLRPDLVRLHRARAILLIADAKATERPDDFATKLRLLGYARAATRWLAAGIAVDLAICHDATDSGHWQRGMESLMTIAGLQVARTGRRDIDQESTVTFLSTQAGVSDSRRW